MKNLAQNETVRQKIRTATTAAIKALHQLIFENDGDRKNRQRLRDFQGFTFREGSPEYVSKLEYAKRLTLGDLISCCNILSLEYDGNKEEVSTRICNSLMDLNTLTRADESSEDEEEESEEDGEDEERLSENENQRGARGRRQAPMNFSMTYKDVESSIKSFSGNDAYPVERWITDFEDTATLFNWTELQQVVFAKKSLTGPAKILVESEGIIKTWKKLKSILKKEFSDKVNSAQLHEMLLKRKMKKEETLQEYYLVMKELASRGKLEPDVLIQYVIDGIQDDTNSKLVLYGARKLEDFKEKLKVYEAIRKKNQEKVKSREKSEYTGKEETARKTMPSSSRKMSTKEQDSETRCYNCGAKGHKSRDCKKKELGKKCFKCQKFGHTAIQCDTVQESKVDKKQSSVNTVICSSNKMLKEVIISDTCVNALIDTGSQVTIMREDIYSKINSEQLLNTTIYLAGFGKGEARSVGCFQTIVKIDDEEFPCTIHVVPENAMSI